MIKNLGFHSNQVEMLDLKELWVFFFNLRALLHFFTRVRAMGRRRRATTPSVISIDGASLLVFHNGSP